MRILFWLGISVALAMTSVATYAADAPAGSASTKSSDEPDAIGALKGPAVDTVDASSAQPASDVGNRLVTATHQLEMKEYADAVPLLESVVGDVERSTSRFDISLVAPLTMLGDAYSGEGKYKEALRAYERARHITRVNDGLHATQQIDLLYRESDAYVALGKPEKANDRQEYAFETLLQAYGPVSPELIPGLYHLGAWYERSSNVFGARTVYERAVEILERNNDHGSNNAELVTALRGLARSYKDERFPPHELPEDRMPGAMASSSNPYSGGEPMGPGPAVVVNRFGPGEVALLQVVKLVSADPAATPLDVALAEIDLADWYLLFDKEARATPVYVHARQIMRERAAMTDDQIAVYFGKPTVLYRPVPDNPAAPPEPLRSNPKEGHVELSYTVTAQGQVDDLKTLSSEPEGMMDLKVRRGMRVARFRPRFEGDSPVISVNQIYRHTFTYYPRPEDAAKHPDAPESADANDPAG
jgi:TonB family protein